MPHSHPPFAPLPPCPPAPPAAERINLICSAFVKVLRGLNSRDMTRDSIRKSSLTNPSRFNVLAQDQQFVLGLLDRAIQPVDDHPLFRYLLSMSMFGQKSPDRLDLGAVVDVDHITCCSVHAACTLVSTHSNLQVMWSRTAQEELVLYPTLSMSECSNFQSNLDDRPPDTSARLLNVLLGGEEHRGTMTFVQVYTDFPHTHIKLAYKHPVSGVIAICDLLHHELTKVMYARAVKYMEHMEDLEAKMVKPLSCRLEQVRLFKTGDCPTVVDPEALFSHQCLRDLVTREPMLVPFLDTEDSMNILTVVQEALEYRLRVTNLTIRIFRDK